jgi:hypothetical protein
MTGQDESHSSPRPISVAELLAKNGTIGAPPVGGRRRRRRGNTDSVTVAELTGEIPIISDHDVHAPETTPVRALVEEEHAEATGPASTNGAVDQVEEVEHVKEVKPDPDVESEPESAADLYEDVDDEYVDAVADYAAHVEQRADDPDLDFFAPPRRSHYAPRRYHAPTGVGAEQMSPDPVGDDDQEDLDSPVDLVEPPEIEEADTQAAIDTKDSDELPSYLRSTQGPLFGGQSVADERARRGVQPGPEDLDLEDEDEDEVDTAAPSAMSTFLRGVWVVGQCVLAVAFGAGLFIAFDQLWKWNNIVALVLSVLVILGLVVGVRVVRKTEDIGSTLIAVAVGALVTLGPLALLQSG